MPAHETSGFAARRRRRKIVYGIATLAGARRHNVDLVTTAFFVIASIP